MSKAVLRGAQAPAGHPPECMCGPCMTADMDAALIRNGMDPARYPSGPRAAAPEPPRGGTPGNGRGARRPATTDDDGATDNQLSFIADLAREREHSEEIPARMSFAEARALIERLKAAPRKGHAPRADRPAAVDVEPGMYERDGVIYRVQRSRTSGRVYAKRGEIVTPAVRDADGTVTTPAVIDFEYEAGAVALLTPEDRMSFDRAREFGAMHGICVYGHPLTDPLSVAAGIGPVCARNWGVSREELAAAAGYVRPTRARKSTPAPVAQVDAEPVAAVEPAAAPFRSRWATLTR